MQYNNFPTLKGTALSRTPVMVSTLGSYNELRLAHVDT